MLHHYFHEVQILATAEAQWKRLIHKKKMKKKIFKNHR